MTSFDLDVWDLLALSAWEFIALGVLMILAPLLFLSLWDWYRLSHWQRQSPDVFRMKDQHRAENMIRLADWQTPAAKGLSEESKRARLEAATKTGTRP